MLFNPDKARIIRASELVAVERREENFVFRPGFLPRGGQMIVAGDQGIGKTWLCLNIVRAAVLGEPLFGNPAWTVASCPGRVLFVEPEVGSMMRERMDHVFQDEERAFEFDFLAPPPGFSILNPDWAEWFGSAVSSRGYELVVLDSIGRLAPYEENSNTDVARLLAMLRYVQGEAALLWTMHFGKAPRDREGWDPLSIDNIRGASKWADDIDAALTLVRKPGRAVAGTEWDNWTLDASWEKARHARGGEAVDRFQVVFNESNGGRMLWRERVARGGRVVLARPAAVAPAGPRDPDVDPAGFFA